MALTTFPDVSVLEHSIPEQTVPKQPVPEQVSETISITSEPNIPSETTSID